MHAYTLICRICCGQFHRTDYFLEREFCTHHERLSPYHLLAGFIRWNCVFLDIFLLFTLFIFFLSSQFFFGCRCHIFRLHKVYRTRYFRLICLILICQHKKRLWLQFEFPFCACDIYEWFLSTLHTDRSVHSSHWNESSRSQSQRVCWCKSRTFVIGILLENSLHIKKLNEFEWV